jgi:hypothetical protein
VNRGFTQKVQARLPWANSPIFAQVLLQTRQRLAPVLRMSLSQALGVAIDRQLP